MSITAFLFCVAIVAIAYAGICAAYRNGVVDGYNYAKWPENPKHQKARKYVCKYMPTGWRGELGQDSDGMFHVLFPLPAGDNGPAPVSERPEPPPVPPEPPR